MSTMYLFCLRSALNVPSLIMVLVSFLCYTHRSIYKKHDGDIISMNDEHDGDIKSAGSN